MSYDRVFCLVRCIKQVTLCEAKAREFQRSMEARNTIRKYIAAQNCGSGSEFSSTNFEVNLDLALQTLLTSYFVCVLSRLFTHHNEPDRLGCDDIHFSVMAARASRLNAGSILLYHSWDQYSAEWNSLSILVFPTVCPVREGAHMSLGRPPMCLFGQRGLNCILQHLHSNEPPCRLLCILPLFDVFLQPSFSLS